MRILAILVTALIAGTAHAAGGGQGEGKLLSADFLFRVINFAILFGGIGYMLAKPVKGFLKSRSDSVRDAINEAKKAKEDAETKARYYEDKLSKLESEVAGMMETFRKEAEEEKDRIIRESREQIEKARERMVKSLEQEKLRIKNEVMVEASGMALRMAEEMLKKNFTPADQKKWVQEYITMMEKIH